MTQPATPQETADRLLFIGANASRFDETEYNQARNGLCITQTVYGMPSTEYCPEPPDYRSLHCMEHGAEIRKREGKNAFGLDIYPLHPDAVEVKTLAELRAVASGIELPSHEPDEYGVSATVTGSKLDNATGVTGPDYVVYLEGPEGGRWVVNLLNLITWARYGA